MKKYILISLCLFSLTGEAQAPLFAKEDIMQQNSPYVERKISIEQVYKESIDTYSYQIKQDIKDFKAHYNRANAYYNYANYLLNIPEFYRDNKEIKTNEDTYFKYLKLAVEDFENALEIDPNSVETYTNLSFALMKIDRVLNKMFVNIDQSFNSKEYMNQLANKKSLYVLGRQKLEKMGRVYNQQLKKIKEIEESKDAADKYAFENIKKAESLSSDNPNVYRAYSEYYLNTADYNKADEYIKKAILSDPQNPDMYNASGLVNIAKKDYNKAIADFEKSLSINPNKSEYIKNISSVYILQNNPDKTFSVLNKGLELEPDNKFLKFNYIYSLNSFLKNNDKDNILQKLKESASQTVNKNTFNEILSNAYIIAGKYEKTDKSLDYIKQSLAIDSDNPKAKTALSDIYINKAGKEKDNAKKIKILDQVIKEIPESTNIRLLLAKTYKDTKAYDKSISEYKYLSDKNTKVADYYYQIALLYAQKKDKKNTNIYLQKAINTDIKYKKISKKENLFRKLR